MHSSGKAWFVLLLTALTSSGCSTAPPLTSEQARGESSYPPAELTLNELRELGERSEGKTFGTMRTDSWSSDCGTVYYTSFEWFKEGESRDVHFIHLDETSPPAIVAYEVDVPGPRQASTADAARTIGLEVGPPVGASERLHVLYRTQHDRTYFAIPNFGANSWGGRIVRATDPSNLRCLKDFHSSEAAKESYGAAVDAADPVAILRATPAFARIFGLPEAEVFPEAVERSASQWESASDAAHVAADALDAWETLQAALKAGDSAPPKEWKAAMRTLLDETVAHLERDESVRDERRSHLVLGLECRAQSIEACIEQDWARELRAEGLTAETTEELSAWVRELTELREAVDALKSLKGQELGAQLEVLEQLYAVQDAGRLRARRGAAALIATAKPVVAAELERRLEAARKAGHHATVAGLALLRHTLEHGERPKPRPLGSKSDATVWAQTADAALETLARDRLLTFSPEAVSALQTAGVAVEDVYATLGLVNLAGLTPQSFPRGNVTLELGPLELVNVKASTVPDTRWQTVTKFAWMANPEFTSAKRAVSELSTAVARQERWLARMKGDRRSNEPQGSDCRPAGRRLRQNSREGSFSDRKIQTSYVDVPGRICIRPIIPTGYTDGEIKAAEAELGRLQRRLRGVDSNKHMPGSWVKDTRIIEYPVQWQRWSGEARRTVTVTGADGHQVTFEQKLPLAYQFVRHEAVEKAALPARDEWKSESQVRQLAREDLAEQLRLSAAEGLANLMFRADSSAPTPEEAAWTRAFLAPAHAIDAASPARALYVLDLTRRDGDPLPTGERAGARESEVTELGEIIGSVVFDPRGRYVARRAEGSSTGDGEICITRLANAHDVLCVPDLAASHVFFGPGDHQVQIVTRNELLTFDVQQRQLLQLTPLLSERSFVELTPDRLAYLLAYELVVQDRESGQLHRIELPPVKGALVQEGAMHLHPSGKWAAVRQWDPQRREHGHISVFDLDTRRVIAQKPTPPGMHLFAWVADLPRIVVTSTGASGAVQLWELRGEELVELDRDSLNYEPDFFPQSALSQDNSASYHIVGPRTIVVTKTDGPELAVRRIHTESDILTASLSPDGEMLYLSQKAKAAGELFSTDGRRLASDLPALDGVMVRLGPWGESIAGPKGKLFRRVTTSDR